MILRRCYRFVIRYVTIRCFGFLVFVWGSLGLSCSRPTTSRGGLMHGFILVLRDWVHQCFISGRWSLLNGWTCLRHLRFIVNTFTCLSLRILICIHMLPMDLLRSLAHIFSYQTYTLKEAKDFPNISEQQPAN